MPKFRAVLRRVTTEDEIIEFEARGIEQAGVMANRAAHDDRLPRRVTIVQPFDKDDDALEVTTVISIEQRPA